MFTSVLVANRGEIAVRIIRTLRHLGIRAVVATSVPDRRGLAAREADATVLLPGYSAAETYLDIDAVIAAARSEGCQAIHPGYGFLSENAAFAEACAAAGLVFIGPPAGVLRALGDKSAARALAIASDVPVVPGWDGEGDLATLLREASRMGFPVMLKARAGGGGRGMRVVQSEESLREAVPGARREAEAAFGDGRLFLEKLVPAAHHVEVQVFADAHGNALHLGERDCTVQRRHQKLIEESPSPVVDAPLREQLTAAALRLMRAAGYVNAGTVEFLVGPPRPRGARAFYFLEVNPRLQVEHPVTEAVTGLDLVELQLRIAAGQALPLQQEDILFTGHAIECRLNAEDPSQGFRPGSGPIQSFAMPAGPVRIDPGYATGDTVPLDYDSLVAKLIATGSHRDDALARAIEGVAALVLQGIPSNAGLHRAILSHAAFRAADISTGWLEERLEELLTAAKPPAEFVGAAALAFALQAAWPLDAAPHLGLPPELHIGSAGAQPRRVTIRRSLSGYETAEGDARLELAPAPWRPGEPLAIRVSPTGVTCRVTLDPFGALVQAEGDPQAPWHFQLVPPPSLPRRVQTAEGSVAAILAPLAGTVVEIGVAAGDTVQAGQLLLVLEAMKMEHRITATAAATVRIVSVGVRDVVTEGQLLLELA